MECICICQVIYELKAGGVDERRLVGAKLEKLAEGESGETTFRVSILVSHLCTWIDEVEDITTSKTNYLMLNIYSDFMVMLMLYKLLIRNEFIV